MNMEDFDKRWVAAEALMLERFGKLPDMEGILFLVGVNELGKLPRRKFSKEQKQDLMHVAVCTLLSRRGYFSFDGRDADGWPHYVEQAPVPAAGLAAQERLLKECLIEYLEL